MPRLIFSLALTLLVFGSIIAQKDYQGTINYTETRMFAMPDDLPPEAEAAMKAYFGDEGIQDRAQLTFNATESSYKALTANEDHTEEDGDVTIVIRRVGQPFQYYTNWEDRSIIYADNVLDQPFLIEDEWEAIEWALDEETPTSMDYQLPARRATASGDDGREIVAWYTSAIPLPIGPRFYGGLPGAIVYMEIKDGEDLTTYRLGSINLTEESPTIEPPTEGRKTDLENFRRIRDERLNQNGGTIMITREMSTDGGR